MLPMFEEKPENEVSYELYKRSVNLPSYFELKEEEIEKVVNVVRSVLHSKNGCK